MPTIPPTSAISSGESDPRPLPADDTRLPRDNEVLRVDGQTMRMVGLLASREDGEGRRLLLLPRGLAFSPFLMAADGDFSLPTLKEWRGLVAGGHVEFLGPAEAGRSVDQPGQPGDRLTFQCELLDRAGVPNGSKSIAVWLHQHWSGTLESRWGPHDNPHTLRRWRSRRRASSAGSTPRT